MNRHNATWGMEGIEHWERSVSFIPRLLSCFTAVFRASQAAEPLLMLLRVCLGQNVLRYAANRIPESGETIGKP